MASGWVGQRWISRLTILSQFEQSSRDFGFVERAFQIQDFTLLQPAKPGLLMPGESSGPDEHFFPSRLQIHFASQVLDDLLIANGLSRRAPQLAPAIEQPSDFLDQSRFEHPIDALLDSIVQHGSGMS